MPIFSYASYGEINGAKISTAGDFKPPDRRAVDQIIDAGKAFAEIVLEAKPGIAHFRKHEAAVVPHMTNARNALRGFTAFEPGMLVALSQRDREQRAVGLERPGVIRAAKEFSGVAAGIDGDARALVRAAVVENVNVAI